MKTIIRRPKYFIYSSYTALSVSLVCVAQEAQAQSSTDEPVIVIFADRDAKSPDKLSNSVTVINQDKLEKAQIKNIHDLQKLDPTISIPRKPARFTAAGSGAGRDQNTGFNIRGLEGSRVLTVVDGVRLPSALSFGASNFGAGDFVDLDSLKNIEIVRGASSTLYGSDGLAGAVSYRTIQPDDLLDIFGKNYYGSLRSGYSSEDKSTFVTGRAAVQAENAELMALITSRNGHEVENKGEVGGVGAARTQANPQDTKSLNGLVKGVWHIAPKHNLGLTLEANKKTVDTDVLSSISVPSRKSTDVLGTKAHDTTERKRVSLSHDYFADLSWLSDLKWQASWQDSKQNQYTFEDRVGVDRTRDNTYKTREFGFNSTAHSDFKTGSAMHRLTYGFDYNLQHISSIRDGTVAPAGEVFPAPMFPKTSYMLGGVYVQDSIKLFDERLEITPGLRYDRYSLKPTETVNTYKYLNVHLSDHALSPRLGLLYRLNDTLSLAANYAHGYKAPEPSQVNSSFANTVSNYAIIGNGNLKAETSRTMELSIRAKKDSWSASLTGYYGQYKNFIDQVVIQGNYTAANPTLLQYVNRNQVELSGIEAKAAYAFTPNWQVQTAFSYNKGEVVSSNQPLNSVNPFKANLALSWDNDGKTIGASTIVNHQSRKKISDVDKTTLATPYVPGSFTVVDVSAYWKISKNFTLNAGINNLTDRKYSYWSDVRGLSSKESNLDAYTQSGRTFSLSLLGQF